MPTSSTAQTTDFSRDVLGRFVCNSLDEALRSAQKTADRPDARPFNVFVIGGGTFGAAVAQHLFSADKSHRYRILVLEGGPHVVPEHVQNLPALGLNPPTASSIAGLRAQGQDRQARNEVWGLPWHSDTPGGFPGLAYAAGGRSLFWGGWSPRPLASELPLDRWPGPVVNDLNTRYFDEASEQLGLTETNDFIHGALHTALRRQLLTAIQNRKVTAAVPLVELPLVVEAGEPLAMVMGAAETGGGTLASEQTDLLKLEAPLAVQSRAARSGFFPANKFSTAPLLAKAARAAFGQSFGDDFKKRLMIVPQCHVKRLAPVVTGSGFRVGSIDTNLGPLDVPEDGAVIVALGTIESARLVLLLRDELPSNLQSQIPAGGNLMAHLRSNLDIRIPRDAIAGLPAEVRELQASALFVKGRHQFSDGAPGHFHLQITACGLGRLGANSEAELFQKIPDIDGLAPFAAATDSHVVITIRGIGEMQPGNQASFVTLDGEADEFGIRRAFTRIQPSARDLELWNVMDQAAMDVAKAFAGSHPPEILRNARDGLGTTHHEAGTLSMGTNGASVTNSDARVRLSENLYAAGPALFPSVGSPNPMLTGIALARRLADKLAARAPVALEPGFQALFDGADRSKWHMSTIRNQPGRDNPGRFDLVDATLESVPGSDLGLLWCTTPTPPNFVLRLEFLMFQAFANSGVFLRFPDPESKGYNNSAFVPVDFGFEVQIDENGSLPANQRTGAIYNQAGQTLTPQPARPPGQWNEFEIRAQGQIYTVLLNGQQVTRFENTNTNRGLATTPNAPSFIGLQTHTARVAFRNLRIKAL
ncbi:MAG: family 16 glycoside hydrolase [Bryobacteraceae bacterium]